MISEPGREMSPDEFRHRGHQIVDWIAEYMSRIREYPVLPSIEPGALRSQLPSVGPEHGEEFDAIWQDFLGLVLPAATHWNHPRFFSFFAISASPPGILGELVMAALNMNGMLWKSGPAATELEQTTLAWLRQWLGLPEDWFGIIYDTASMSTLHAIASAREWADPQARIRGAQPGFTLYTSEQAHSSVEKSAIALGVGQENVRKVPVDDAFRMRADALQQMITADRAAGKHPFCVVASIGTTSTTSVDPVPAIAALAREHNLWLHVDAAYGGAMALVPEFRHLFAGVEQADSLVVNPHKWMLVPVDLSAFYTRRPDVLRRAFTLVPAYLETREGSAAVNLMDYGVQLGRRFRALKLWFVLRYYGREGLAAMIRRHCEWARQLAEQVSQDSRFELMAPVPMSTVCFRYCGSDAENQQIVEQVNASGQFFLSQTLLRGRFTLRTAIGNLRTEWQDVAALWQAVQAAAPRHDVPTPNHFARFGEENG